jgi:hypothetical protein
MNRLDAVLSQSAQIVFSLLDSHRQKLLFYSAFVDGKLDAQKRLLPDVHRLYFEPLHA